MTQQKHHATCKKVIESTFLGQPATLFHFMFDEPIIVGLDDEVVFDHNFSVDPPTMTAWKKDAQNDIDQEVAKSPD